MRRLILLTALLAACQVAPKFEDLTEGTVLANKPGFSCELPSGWTKDDLDPNRPEGSSWRDPGDTVKVRLSFQKAPPATLEELGKSLTAGPRVKDLKLEKEGPLQLAGVSAYEVVYQATINQRARWHRDILALHPKLKDRLVIVSFLANPGSEGTKDFQVILDTWKWD